MNNISRDNHFVAQMYLEAWKNSNNKVWTYDLLVPNENCNLWREKSIKSIASLQNFYINLKEKEEVDEIEKYLNEEFETPASMPLKKETKRYVNLDEFQREKEMIENWHNNYKNIESEYLEHKLLRRDSDETRRL